MERMEENQDEIFRDILEKLMSHAAKDQMDSFPVTVSEVRESFPLERSSQAVCDHYFNIAIEHYEECRSGNPAIPMTFFSITENSKTAYILDELTNRTPRAAVVEFMKSRAKVGNAISCAMVNEGYLSVIRSQEDLNNFVAPSRDPNRMEVVMVQGEYVGMKPRIRLGHIIRDSQGGVLSVKEMIMGKPGSDQVIDGLLTNFLSA